MENLNKKRIEKVQDAVWLFLSSARYYKPNTSVALPMFGTLLYLLKKKCICTVNNVDANDPNIITIINQEYLAILNEDILAEWLEKGIQNEALYSTLPEDDELSDIIKEYLKEIVLLPEPQFIFDTVSILSKNELLSDDYLSLFDMMLNNIITNIGRNAGFFAQPKEMIELIAEIISPKCKDIFNPFSGLMSYAIRMNNYNKFDAVENDRETWNMGRIRVALADKNDQVYSKLDDLDNWPNEKYDAIVSTPPIGIQNTFENRKELFKWEFSKIIPLLRFDTSTTDIGELYTYVSLRVLDSEAEKNIRVRIVENNWLEAVILMPSGLLNTTNVSTALVILKKNRDINSPIKMINATTLYHQNDKNRILNVEAIVEAYKSKSSKNRFDVYFNEIKENLFSWYVPLYQANCRIHPNNYLERRFDEIVEIVQGEGSFNETEGHQVQPDLLSKSTYLYKKDPDNFPVEQNLKNYVKFSEPVLLLSKIGQLNPTYCEASEDNPIFVSTNICGLKIKDSKIHVGFLCYELNDALMSMEKDKRYSFSPISIMHLKLFFPRTIEEQKLIFSARQKEAVLSKAREIGLEEVIKKMKKDYMDVQKARRHDMFHYMRALGSSVRNIRTYILRKEEYPDYLERILRNVEKHQEKWQTLNELIEMYSEEDEFGEAVPFNVDDYFWNMKMNHHQEDSNFIIEYDCDEDKLEECGLPVHEFYKKSEEVILGVVNDNRIPNIESLKKELSEVNNTIPLFVDIAPLAFKRLVDNILNNAQNHGFTDVKRTDYCLYIYLTVDADKDMFIIEFRNNGHPLPKGMDKVSYGKLGVRAGEKGGKGEGGNIVKKIVERYGGDYDVFMKDQTNVIKILLPISNKSRE